jgi:hypothetical protein
MTELQSATADVKKYKGLQALAESDGGKTLLDNLRRQIASDVDTLSGLLKGTDVEIRAAIARLNADLYVYRTLLNADHNAKIASEDLQSLLDKQEEQP